jgi:hypothetical protein
MLDCVSRKNVIEWMRMMLIMFLHMKSIHMNTKEDGKNDDQENW